MVKVGSRNIVLIALFTLLINSCKKEQLPVISNRIEVVSEQKKPKAPKKKRKVKLFRIFRKKVAR
jgi:hypothetical protein